MSTSNLIKTYLEHVLTDFKKNDWCDMNNFKLNTNSYQLKVNQQRYILKYFAAYFCEYYHTYSETLKKAIEHKISNINIMSIGCGCGVDFYALNCMVKDEHIECLNITYTGIDAINWSYRPEGAPIKSVFENKLFINISADDVANINIFTFPKSLTELNSSELSKFGKNIADNNKQDRIFFINSYITDDSSAGERVGGIGKFKNVFDELIKGGYSTEGDPSSYTHLTEGDAGLSKNFDFFKIPDEVVEQVKNLKSKCEHRLTHKHQCQSCNIDFWPMMKGKYLAYKIFEFVRKK